MIKKYILVFSKEKKLPIFLPLTLFSIFISNIVQQQQQWSLT